MYRNLLNIVLALFCLSGCAERVINIADKEGRIVGGCSERKLGYILAAIEYEYQKVTWPAEDDFANGKITRTELNKIIKDAKFKWLGE